MRNQHFWLGLALACFSLPPVAAMAAPVNLSTLGFFRSSFIVLMSFMVMGLGFFMMFIGPRLGRGLKI